MPQARGQTGVGIRSRTFLSKGLKVSSEALVAISHPEGQQHDVGGRHQREGDGHRVAQPASAHTENKNTPTSTLEVLLLCGGTGPERLLTCAECAPSWAGGRRTWSEHHSCSRWARLETMRQSGGPGIPGWWSASRGSSHHPRRKRCLMGPSHQEDWRKAYRRIGNLE